MRGLRIGVLTRAIVLLPSPAQAQVIAPQVVRLPSQWRPRDFPIAFPNSTDANRPVADLTFTLSTTTP